MKTVFVGNRTAVLESIAADTSLHLVAVFALAGSTIRSAPSAVPLIGFQEADKRTVVERLRGIDFDLLVSNGCPFRLPIGDLSAGKPRHFLNVHPSLLPQLRGRHPVNGALLFGLKRTGVTLHRMDDEIDTGRVIHRLAIDITDDIDAPLLYEMLFRLEGRVFQEGIKKLVESDWLYPGEPQIGGPSVYTRRPEDQRVDFTEMSDEEIRRRIRAFAVWSQGVSATIEGHPYRIIAADSIVNPAILAEFSGRQPGTILLRYEEKMLIKTRDGIVRLMSWRPGDR